MTVMTSAEWSRATDLWLEHAVVVDSPGAGEIVMFGSWLDFEATPEERRLIAAYAVAYGYMDPPPQQEDSFKAAMRVAVDSTWLGGANQ